MTPSELLTKAADLVRDTAAAPHLEAILRESAESAARHVPVWQTVGRQGPKRPDADVAELVELHYGRALALARAVLGVKEGE